MFNLNRFHRKIDDSLTMNIYPRLYQSNIQGMADQQAYTSTKINSEIIRQNATSHLISVTFFYSFFCRSFKKKLIWVFS